MKFLKTPSKARDILLIIVGTALIAVSINMVYDQMGIVNGGVTGIGIILKHFTAIPIWVTNIVLNVPIFICAFIMLGRRATFMSLIADLLLTAFLAVCPQFPLFGDDITLSAVFGGIIGGTGMGLVFLCSATTGGTDMLSALIHKKLRHYTLPQIMFVVDGVIIVAGFAVFGIKISMYALIAIFVSNKVSDALLEGFKFAKIAYIITDHGKEIADEIMVKLDRGVTGFDATGMYSGNHKDVLMCAVSKKEIVEVLDIVNKKDPVAFVTVHDAREVCGEGFVENTH
jgi:uncharacterized membrane-anchored protein YitT (DUF2179 family)